TPGSYTHLPLLGQRVALIASSRHCQQGLNQLVRKNGTDSVITMQGSPLAPEPCSTTRQPAVDPAPDRDPCRAAPHCGRYSLVSRIVLIRGLEDRVVAGTRHRASFPMRTPSGVNSLDAEAGALPVTATRTLAGDRRRSYCANSVG